MADELERVKENYAKSYKEARQQSWLSYFNRFENIQDDEVIDLFEEKIVNSLTGKKYKSTKCLPEFFEGQTYFITNEGQQYFDLLTKSLNDEDGSSDSEDCSDIGSEEDDKHTASFKSNGTVHYENETSSKDFKKITEKSPEKKQESFVNSSSKVHQSSSKALPHTSAIERPASKSSFSTDKNISKNISVCSLSTPVMLDFPSVRKYKDKLMDCVTESFTPKKRLMKKLMEENSSSVKLSKCSQRNPLSSNFSSMKRAKDKVTDSVDGNFTPKTKLENKLMEQVTRNYTSMKLSEDTPTSPASNTPKKKLQNKSYDSVPKHFFPKYKSKKTFSDKRIENPSSMKRSKSTLTSPASNTPKKKLKNKSNDSVTENFSPGYKSKKTLSETKIGNSSSTKRSKSTLTSPASSTPKKKLKKKSNDSIAKHFSPRYKSKKTLSETKIRKSSSMKRLEDSLESPSFKRSKYQIDMEYPSPMVKPKSIIRDLMPEVNTPLCTLINFDPPSSHKRSKYQVDMQYSSSMVKPKSIIMDQIPENFTLVNTPLCTLRDFDPPSRRKTGSTLLEVTKETSSKSRHKSSTSRYFSPKTITEGKNSISSKNCSAKKPRFKFLDIPIERNKELDDNVQQGILTLKRLK